MRKLVVLLQKGTNQLIALLLYINLFGSFISFDGQSPVQSMSGGLHDEDGVKPSTAFTRLEGFPK